MQRFRNFRNKSVSKKSIFYDDSQVQSKINVGIKNIESQGEVVGLCYKNHKKEQPRKKYTEDELRSMVYIDDNNQVVNIKTDKSNKSS